ncbi:30S ribosomal protein S5 [Candidatus Shapirobacteria bacterium CG08_land_8_20_14_0_20_39_18]|uniref:Small ribosomal subunit protein uS5 n=1 Tax=Candidatus Shapirobacteria bacterium CG08_land_8_20_14_0_20_39_18 TaxID=1974883 RepID=A0A2M6XEB1_9BACT|nr:MAG: 30S ribosomal protein S5 [Candidatus Shapirobacteria bacterium CG08_land_8_20_14_0_20_39_18]PIY66419.1 MAG: 30S ribosomal protein S5 [Candidatus Shapirobacteria bacterium CG_4_10_14_0_8_um_filter_39_15]PJE68391.1 MAG: 30S ribosomal protein S5 [Candidatus Shapirobacteria bacterium CG10_big_fil_rev_8_21_14_0_10_38_8]
MPYRSNYNQNLPKVQSEFEEKIIQVNRVSKKTKGGNRSSFSVLMVVGDRKDRLGVGLGKATEVSSAVVKATTYAKKHLITIPLKGNTIPHEVYVKLGAAKVLLKPAPPGAGVIAGGTVRTVIGVTGIRDIVSKCLGTKNKASNVYATMEALKKLRILADRNIGTRDQKTETNNIDR